MTVQIQKKIKAIGLKKEDAPEAESLVASVPAAVVMNEAIGRPETLRGSTYKIKNPMTEHAMYVTINNMVLNEGTDHEILRPFEIFVNSKNMDHFQWITALTRIISAVFRKGGDATFLVEELRHVFDPKGGYFKKGGRFMPSLVAEIGDILEQHFTAIGLMQSEGPDEHQLKLIKAKRAQYDEQTSSKEVKGGFPAGAQLCGKCQTKALIKMEGCLTCLNCGDSKCQ